MSDDYEDEPFGDLGDPDEEHSIEVNGETRPSGVTGSNLVEVAGNITAHWDGVRSCCDQDRADKAYRAAFQRWLKIIKGRRPEMKFQYAVQVLAKT